MARVREGTGWRAELCHGETRGWLAVIVDLAVAGWPACEANVGEQYWISNQ